MKPSPVLAEVTLALYRKARFENKPSEKRLPDGKVLRVTDDGRVAISGGSQADADTVMKSLDWPPKHCQVLQKGRWLCVYLTEGHL